ncbi:MAG TPA: heme exporter protein CcmB, partial [Marinobacter hydrocarbonoclasticus]|nr:heme exporter protein CcmB [Marinobacter nauticus]
MNVDRRPALKPVSESVGPIAAMAAVFARDVRVAFRQRQDLLNPLLFFIMVVTLFPLGVSP